MLNLDDTITRENSSSFSLDNTEFQGVQVDPIYPGYPEDMFVTETTPGKTAKPSGIVQ